MLTTIIAASALLGGAPKGGTTIVAASLFKNGYAVVTREVPLVDGEAIISDIPQAALGTFWVTATPGVTLSEVVNGTEESTVKSAAGSIDEVLALNEGKELVLMARESGKVEGKLLSAAGSALIIQTQSGVLVIPKSSVSSVLGSGIAWSKESKTTRRVIRVKGKGPASAKVILVGLERGMTWAPAYSIDISNEKKLSIIGKATILNDLGDLDGIETRLITGFPNVPFAGSPDPFTSGANVDQFVGGLIALGAPEAAKAPGMMTQNAMRRDRAQEFDEAFQVSTLPGLAAEDLFFYRQPAVALKKGERGYYVLFKSEAEYEHLYTWSIPDTLPDDNRPQPDLSTIGDVWHALKFKNGSSMPWTTAPATVFKNGEILGQDESRYTAVGADALIRITKALDVRADQSEEEIERERGALKVNSSNPTHDLVTVKGTLEIQNRKPEAIKMKVTKDVTGEVTASTGDAKVMKNTKGLRDVNAHARIEWTPTVAAGKTITLTYTYKVYVPTRGY